MNVLSLFDGMSCGQIALERAGIKVDKYYASEIDKYAINITQKNFPETIQLGDVTCIKVSDLPKIDLLIGGSPCQGFSYAGKQLNFDDPRSALFFEFVKLLEKLKPKYFLLENVKMKKEFQNIITTYMGVKPIEINSALVSAQNRRRLYWTNIPDITQPKAKGILLKDILEVESKPLCYFKGDMTRPYTISSVNDNSRVKKITENERGYRPHRGDIKSTGISELGRLLKKNSKTDTLTTNHSPKLALNDDISNLKFRKLTPIECERLQTVPDNYTEGVSNTQRYKMLGNGWTVDIIAHIFKELKIS